MIYRKRRKTNFWVYNSTETLQQAKMWTLYCVFFHHVIVSNFANRISKATIGKLFFWLSFLRWKGLSNWRGQPLDITSRSSNMRPFAQVYRLFVLTDIPAFLRIVFTSTLEFQAVFYCIAQTENWQVLKSNYCAFFRQWGLNNWLGGDCNQSEVSWRYIMSHFLLWVLAMTWKGFDPDSG